MAALSAAAVRCHWSICFRSTRLHWRSGSEYDLYRFNQAASGAEWENYKAHTEDFELVNGQGYLYASKEDLYVFFNGAFNEGTTKDVPLACSGNGSLKGWNLVGNPFPVNAYSNRPFFVMNGAGNGVIATTISTNNPIAPCTGIIVQATPDEQNPTVTFSTTAPETSSQGDINILLSQRIDYVNTIIDNAIISFNEGDQLGKFVFTDDNAKVYIHQNDKDYAIAVTNPKSEMPIHFKAAHYGEYALTVTINDLEMDYLHLIDNLTGNDVDLLQTPTYSFSAQSNDYASRFRLVFKDNGIDENVTNHEFALISDGEIIINGSGTIQVVDMMGRIVFCRDGVHTVSTTGLTPGVYFLRLIKDDHVKNQKIIIK